MPEPEVICSIERQFLKASDRQENTINMVSMVDTTDECSMQSGFYPCEAENGKMSDEADKLPLISYYDTVNYQLT